MLSQTVALTRASVFWKLETFSMQDTFLNWAAKKMVIRVIRAVCEFIDYYYFSMTQHASFPSSSIIDAPTVFTYAHQFQWESYFSAQLNSQLSTLNNKTQNINLDISQKQLLTRSTNNRNKKQKNLTRKWLLV